MRILAHRGASGYAPENTFAAFDLARRMKAPALETDVRLSRDRVPILIHDERLDRTTNGAGPVADLAWSELSQLDAGGWFDGGSFRGESIPRLDAFLSRYAGAVDICLELKTGACVGPVVDLIRRRELDQPVGRIEFSSFEWDLLAELHEAIPRNPVALLVRTADLCDEHLRRAADAGFAMYCPNAKATTAELVRKAHALGLRVRTYGIREPEDLHHVVACGADGTTLNWPDWPITNGNGSAAPTTSG